MGTGVSCEGMAGYSGITRPGTSGFVPGVQWKFSEIVGNWAMAWLRGQHRVQLLTASCIQACGLFCSKIPSPCARLLDRCLCSLRIPTPHASRAPPGDDIHISGTQTLERVRCRPIVRAARGISDQILRDGLLRNLHTRCQTPAHPRDLLVHEQLLVAAGHAGRKHPAIDNQVVPRPNGGQQAERLLPGVLLIVGVIVRVGRRRVARDPVEPGQLRPGNAAYSRLDTPTSASPRRISVVVQEFAYRTLAPAFSIWAIASPERHSALLTVNSPASV